MISNRCGISFVGGRIVLKLDVDVVVFSVLRLMNFILCELCLSKTRNLKKKKGRGWPCISVYIPK